MRSDSLEDAEQEGDIDLLEKVQLPKIKRESDPSTKLRGMLLAHFKSKNPNIAPPSPEQLNAILDQLNQLNVGGPSDQSDEQQVQAASN
jgi:hypothetical protein